MARQSCTDVSCLPPTRRASWVDPTVVMERRNLAHALNRSLTADYRFCYLNRARENRAEDRTCARRALNSDRAAV